MDTRDITLHDSIKGQTDLHVGYLPSVPVRLAILEAYNAAAGWRPDADGEVQHRPELMDEADLAAVYCAVLGESWVDHRSSTVRDGPGGLRAYKRDVVAYGEAVYTWLWDRGYRSPDVGKAAEELVGWWSEATFALEQEAAAAEEGFGKAQP